MCIGFVFTIRNTRTCVCLGTVVIMDQITIKTPNPKCRLYWCIIEFIDWRDSQSCCIFYPSRELTGSSTIYCKQLISNGRRSKPAFAKRDKKQTMIDLRGISTNWLKNQLCSSIRLSRLRAQSKENWREVKECRICFSLYYCVADLCTTMNYYYAVVCSAPLPQIHSFTSIPTYLPLAVSSADVQCHTMIVSAFTPGLCLDLYLVFSLAKSERLNRWTAVRTSHDM